MNSATKSVDRAGGRSFLLLAVAALLTLSSTVLAGTYLYWSTQRLISASDWITHTEEVLNTLTSIAQRIDRIDSIMNLYAATRNAGDMRSAETTTVVLQTNLEHLRALVADNPKQRQNAQEIAASVLKVVQSLELARTTGGPLPSGEVFAARRAISLSQETERTLLQQRTETTRRSAAVTLASSVVFTLLALLLEVALFGFLIQDELSRRRTGRELVDANQRATDTIVSMEERAREVRMLTAARDELQLCQSAQEAYQSTVRFATQLLPNSTGALCLINNSRQTVERVSAWGRESLIQESFPLHSCCGLRSGHPRWRRPLTSEVHCSHFRSEPPPPNYVCIPMSALSDTIGVAYLECAITPSEQQFQTMKSLLELASMAIAGLNLRHKLENQSIRDSLTGLFNRHFMEISLERELRRAARQQSPLAVFMIDADHFKDFNDTFGHDAGDYVLREISEVFRSAIRSEDIACRYGGEEFVIILPDIPAASAFERAETIRQSVADTRLRLGGEVLREVTISIGIAMYPDDGEVVEQLMRTADRNLYKAKQRGRDQVVAGETMLVSGGRI